MRYITLLTLLISSFRVDADPLPPLSLIQKNKKANAGKDEQGPRPGKASRVVGGKQVTSTTKYKWFVEWADSHCGGSLIHDDIVLTAGHCESTTSPFNIQVYINGLESRKGMFRTVEQQVSHPLYKVEANNDYDFMLLKLHDSAKIDENGEDTGAEFVPLNTERNIPQPEDPLLAVGFGFTVEGAGVTSAVLNDVEVKYVNDTECLRQYGKDIYVSDLMFCAGVEGGGKDTCQGDSGGPIIDMKTNNQVGVVSFGSGCARATHNGVYARVSSVTDWIQSSICALSDYPPTDWQCPPKQNFTGIGEGNGNIGVSVTYDGYARETAFSLVNDEHGVQLYFQSYDAKNAVNHKTETHEFDDLPAGNYTLMLGDNARDGFCCLYGDGELVVKDRTTNKALWTVTDNWASEYVAGHFSVDESGLVTFNGNTSDYDNSWELSPVPPNNPEENDQAWPGLVPNSPKKLNINVRFDRFPQDTSWELAIKDGPFWAEMETFDGAGEEVHNDLVSTQLTNLEAGWYRFSIKDRKNDGICCEDRRGWVTVTGFLEGTRQPGVVWKDDGEFGSGVVAYIQVLNSGMTARVVDDESAMGR